MNFLMNLRRLREIDRKRERERERRGREYLITYNRYGLMSKLLHKIFAYFFLKIKTENLLIVKLINIIN